MTVISHSSSQAHQHAKVAGRTVKAAIIGVGRMGLTHLSILGGHPFLRVTAVADGKSLITRAISRFRTDIKLYDDYQKMLRNEELDAVLIATPPVLHGPMIEAAMDRNISIFVEKPFTLDASESRRFALRSAGQNTAFHQVGYVARFGDVYMKVKELLQSGLLGRIVNYRIEMNACTILKKENGTGWRGTRKTGGGCLNELGSHAVDMAINLFGKPSRVVGSSLVSIYSEFVDDMVNSSFLHEDGIIGSICANWSDPSYRKPMMRSNILGDNGRIEADFYGLRVFMNKEGPSFKKGWNTVTLPEIVAPVPFYVRGVEFTRQLYAFAEGVRDPGRSNRCSFADGAATQEIVDMVFADATAES